MTYTSLKSPENPDYTYDLNIAHLYGNLLNTYGDNGNVLMIKYVGEKLGAKMTFDIVSVGDDFRQGPLRHGLLWRWSRLRTIYRCQRSPI